MITETSDEILARLKEIPGVKTFGEWVGQVEDLLKKPHLLPSLHVVYNGAKFSAPEIIGDNVAPHRMGFAVILISRNLRSRQSGALDCYQIIESVRAKLIGYQTTAGWLWPEREELVSAEKGILAYGLEYTIDTETE